MERRSRRAHLNPTKSPTYPTDLSVRFWSSAATRTCARACSRSHLRHLFRSASLLHSSTDEWERNPLSLPTSWFPTPLPTPTSLSPIQN
eukprot:6172155-Pleurochrysis_carterae.AAC.1